MYVFPLLVTHWLSKQVDLFPVIYQNCPILQHSFYATRCSNCTIRPAGPLIREVWVSNLVSLATDFCGFFTPSNGNFNPGIRNANETSDFGEQPIANKLFKARFLSAFKHELVNQKSQKHLLLIP